MKLKDVKENKSKEKENLKSEHKFIFSLLFLFAENFAKISGTVFGYAFMTPNV